MSTRINAQDAANYFLSLVNEEEGDSLSHLKLQKLLYFAQGLFAAMHPGERLFPDRIYAWDLGPVVTSIYYKYKEGRAAAIPKPENFDASSFAPEVREMLETVFGVYGQFSASRLVGFTHDEPPYKNTKPNDEITIESLREFFAGVVEAGRQEKCVAGEPLWPTNSLRFQRRKELSNRMSAHRGALRRIASLRGDRPDPWLDDDED